jgi:hypothetical protein
MVSSTTVRCLRSVVVCWGADANEDGSDIAYRVESSHSVAIMRVLREFFVFWITQRLDHWAAFVVMCRCGQEARHNLKAH